MKQLSKVKPQKTIKNQRKIKSEKQMQKQTF